MKVITATDAPKWTLARSTLIDGTVVWRVQEVPAGTKYATADGTPDFETRAAALAALAGQPLPFSSWTVEGDTQSAPKPMPEKGDWRWDEAGQAWVDDEDLI